MLIFYIMYTERWSTSRNKKSLKYLKYFGVNLHQNLDEGNLISKRRRTRPIELMTDTPLWTFFDYDSLRYSCVSCPSCIELDFLNCTNKYNGAWNFKRFEIQATILYKLLDPLFGVVKMVQWNGKSKDAKATRKQNSQIIKRLIVSYLRCIIP